ncbi:MAG TPA: hypothetical protein ACFYD2_03645, partial [Candidatus Avalokitesvara rifleensis]|uniref:hypothetical protein n=1 Tax=Candidatus Avalokitesvara rifleensis TaxID=3367620 RepID=UPI004025AC7A
SRGMRNENLRPLKKSKTGPSLRGAKSDEVVPDADSPMANNLMFFGFVGAGLAPAQDNRKGCPYTRDCFSA